MQPAPDEQLPLPVRSRLRRRLFRASILVLLWLAVSACVAYRLTRRPRAIFPEPAPNLAWGRFEPHRLKTADGEEIGAWLLRGQHDAPAVLLIHGNGGSRWNCLGRAQLLASRGYTVLMISLRAHGDSTGDFNDVGFSARHDVIAAVDFLERDRPGRSIVVLGTSMGGAAALFASGDLGHRVAGYILESPYLDLKTALWNRVEDALPPVLDRVAYGGLMAVAPFVLPHLSRISPLDAIDGVPPDVPILILAGADDRAARPSEARALFGRVRSHGELLIFPDTGHLQTMDRDLPLYREAVFRLIDAATKH